MFQWVSTIQIQHHGIADKLLIWCTAITRSLTAFWLGWECYFVGIFLLWSSKNFAFFVDQKSMISSIAWQSFNIIIWTMVYGKMKFFFSETRNLIEPNLNRVIIEWFLIILYFFLCRSEFQDNHHHRTNFTLVPMGKILSN